MAVLDIILLLCFVPAIVGGITKGFVKQLVDLASILLGAWAAFRFSTPACDWLKGQLTMDPKLLYVICFVIIIVASVLLLNLIGQAMCKVIKIASLGWLNRLAGLALGILKTAILLGLIIMAFEYFNGQWDFVDEEKLENAVVYDSLRSFIQAVFPHLKQLITSGCLK